MQQASSFDRFLTLIATTRLLGARAERMHKRRRFKRFWLEIEPALRERPELDERPSKTVS
jgi:hypothetical protein